MNPFRIARLMLASGWILLALSIAGMIVAPHFGGGQFAGIGIVLDMFMLDVVVALLLLGGCILGLQAARAEPKGVHLGDKLFVGSSAVLLVTLTAFLFETGVWQTLAR